MACHRIRGEHSTAAHPIRLILVDSRTGITEIGGLCVGPLADRLVVFSSLNDQNIEGTRTFLREAGIATSQRSAAGRVVG